MGGTPIRSTCFDDGMSRRIIGLRAEFPLAYQVSNTLRRFKCCPKQGRINSRIIEQQEISRFSLLAYSQEWTLHDPSQLHTLTKSCDGAQ